MNILVFSWRDPKHPLAGGAEQSMHEHMKGWVRAGHNVTHFSSMMKGLSRIENLDGVKIIRQGYQYWGVQFAGFFYYLKNKNKNKIDFIVDQFHGIPFFTPLYSKKPKLAVLQEVAREVWFKNPLKFPLNILVGLIGYFGEPFLFWLFYRNTQFMVGSNSAKEDLIKFGIKDKNITVVPHGIVLPNKIPEHKMTNPKVITYFGPLTADKGIIDALNVFRLLNTSGKYSFCVIGRPETDAYYKKVMDTVKQFGLEDKIKFWRRPTDEEKFEILSKTYLFINSSIREGWGLVNMEANLVGTPVVAYPSPGLVDSVKHGVSGILTKSSSPEAIAREIEKLFSDSITYNKLSEGAKKWAAKFSYEESARMSIELINKLS